MKKAKIDDVVRVSTNGQIVLPTDVRRRLGIVAGKKLAVSVQDGAVILRKLESVGLREISERVSDEARSQGIDVSRLVREAVQWARRQS